MSPRPEDGDEPVSARIKQTNNYLKYQGEMIDEEEADDEELDFEQNIEEYKQELSNRKFSLFQTTFQNNNQFLGGAFYRFNDTESGDAESESQQPDSKRSEGP